MVAKTSVFGAFLATLLLASMAAAQPLHLQPGSVLVYPLFDSTPGAGTLICVTNTNLETRYCEGTDYRAGDVLVHFQYIDGDDCLEFDRYEFLSPGDTLCVIADRHDPEGGHGYAVLSAASPTTSEKIAFDYLIGSAIVVQSDLNFLWSYTPYAFQALPKEEGLLDPCLRPTTDDPAGDGDGAMDFDGIEYTKFPRELFIDSFFEERDNFGNQLTLMSTSGQDWINEVEVLIWNNIESRYSRTLKFVCWWSGPLTDISAIAGDLGGDEEEMGHPPVQTGWVHIRGNRILDLSGNPVEVGDGIPPMLGVFAQARIGTDYAGGRALQYRGTIDGLEILNGDNQ